MMRSLKQPAKVAMLLLLAVLLLSNGVGNVHGKTIHDNSVDLHALLDFKKGITNDPQALSNWSTNTHFCRWNGVNCTTTRPFRVSSLNLTGQNIQGQISSSLGNLTLLTTLDISGNSFAGPLPMLGHLQKLQILYLNNNNLSGIIPDSLTNCSSLASLDLSVNSLAGVIPTRLGLLSNMEYINFKSNQLEGSIPDELGKLSNLQYLLLGSNRLSGEFPHAILNLPLRSLSLEFNMLGQALPPNIGDFLHDLTELTLEYNMFEGQIPVSLGNAAGLEIIDLSSNSFTGKIPTAFGKLSNLTFLNLQYNHLEARDDQDWEFLNSLRNCSSLKILSLSFNELQGLLPESVGNLSSSLEQLFLAANSLSGQVPQSIGKLGGLTKLSLVNNSFTGKIPTAFGKLSKLTFLYLQYNQLEARDDQDWEFLISLKNCSSLKILSLSFNELQGLLPESVGDLSSSLEELWLTGNSLSGQVPQSIGKLGGLTKLSLADNSFYW